MSENHSPILIVGCGHSGTSILLNIIGSHSRIAAIPHETSFACGKSVPDARTTAFLRDCESLVARQNKTRWVEKTPRHIMYLGKITTLLPDAQIIIVIRDGRDVACSLQDRFGDLEGGIKRWVRQNREGQKYWEHPNVHCLRYEQLVQDPVGTLTQAMTFLGEKLEPEMLQYYTKPKYYYSDSIERPVVVTAGAHAVYRNWQINQPLFDGRGKWLRMTEAEKQLVKARAGEMLIEYRYADDLEW